MGEGRSTREGASSLVLYICLVIDTDNTELLKKCGTELPDKITSQGNRLTVKFKTDHSVSAKVGQITWVFLQYFVLFKGIQSNLERGNKPRHSGGRIIEIS